MTLSTGRRTSRWRHNALSAPRLSRRAWRCTCCRRRKAECLTGIDCADSKGAKWWQRRVNTSSPAEWAT